MEYLGRLGVWEIFFVVGFEFDDDLRYFYLNDTVRVATFAFFSFCGSLDLEQTDRILCTNGFNKVRLPVLRAKRIPTCILPSKSKSTITGENQLTCTQGNPDFAYRKTDKYLFKNSGLQLSPRL